MANYGPSRLFTKFVEIGRVAVVNYGPDSGKLVTVIDIIDQNRVLVDGPRSITGVPRHALKTQYLTLTDLKVDIGRGVRSKVLEKAWTDADIKKKYEATKEHSQVVKRQTKANLSDFERFKLTTEKSKRSEVAKRVFHQLRRAHNKSNPKNPVSRRKPANY
eukprot:TRINITY_DN3512_c0_g1_i1.p1 TRINITY_DN3512_c0_g1~~TRINITY_DN3512_c0_g1_i1.p1  ORF type:complete len:161 (+),score=40.53 TRINITY_DN3512_c0_g1_i1:60-542(+)